MGSDMVVALIEASANRTTLFGLNHHAAPGQRLSVQVATGQMHDLGEVTPTCALHVPQARQTFSVLGMQPLGQWGFVHGVNEKRVAIGMTDWQSRLDKGPQALGGPELVRLTLERSHSALHAVEVLTDLLGHYEHCPVDGMAPVSNDHIYLIADGQEAYLLEVCGRFWGLLECVHTRVVTDAAMIRQDWRRLAPGLAHDVIEHGWWRDDGSKIDFVRCLTENDNRSKNAQKRWGRASLALAQQQGAIDLHYLRRMLADHYAANRDLLSGGKTNTLANSFLVDLPDNDQPILAWVAYGMPAVAVYFPICLAGELPAAFHAGPPTIQERTQELQRLALGKEKDRSRLTLALERLQTKFDQEADDFVVKAHHIAASNKAPLIAQLATEMMHRCVDQFDTEYRRLFGLDEKPPHLAPVEEEVLFFA